MFKNLHFNYEENKKEKTSSDFMPIMFCFSPGSLYVNKCTHSITQTLKIIH